MGQLMRTQLPATIALASFLALALVLIHPGPQSAIAGAAPDPSAQPAASPSPAAYPPTGPSSGKGDGSSSPPPTTSADQVIPIHAPTTDDTNTSHFVTTTKSAGTPK